MEWHFGREKGEIGPSIEDFLPLCLFRTQGKDRQATVTSTTNKQPAQPSSSLVSGVAKSPNLFPSSSPPLPLS